MNYETLIEPPELHAHLHLAHPGGGAANWSIVDCRFDLAQPGAGREAYKQGHIPGAHYAHLDEDLSSPVTADTGRHPLPDPQRFAARLGQWGIGNSTQVIAYDNGNGAYASRLWWLLRWLGHRRVAVLNGGLQAWLALGYPTDTRPAAAGAERFQPRPQEDTWLSASRVQSGLAAGTIALIDARGADRFAGQNETIDPVAGHVPGARNHPFTSNLDTSLRFLPADELRRRWVEVVGAADAGSVVCMCGSGVTACHNLLALELAGLSGARLYAGSWSEWIRDPSRPVTR